MAINAATDTSINTAINTAIDTAIDIAVVVVDFNWSCSVQRVDRDSKWLPKEATPDLRGAPHLMGWSRMTLVWASLVIVPVRFF